MSKTMKDFTGPPHPPGLPGPSGRKPVSGGGMYIMPPGTPQDSDSEVPSTLNNLNERCKDDAPVLFRDRLIESTLSVLIGHSKPNALLVGPAGVGKSAIAEDIARRLATKDPLIPAQLNGYTIYELPSSNIVAGSMFQGQLEAKIQAVIDFASDKANKAIIFIDEIHTIVNTRDPSTSKIAQILKPALARGDIHLIGATTTQEARALDADPAFRRRFSRLVVDELTPEQTLTVLGAVRPGLTSHYGDTVTVADELLEDVVRIADESTQAGSHRPDNAITLLDRSMADRLLEHKRMITEARAAGDTATADLLEAQTSVPLTANRIRLVAQRMSTGQAVRPTIDVDTLDAALAHALRGQDEAREFLVDQIRRRELGVFAQNKPTTMMFAGASGVGKTVAARVIAEHTTGQKPIVLDMSEYSHAASVNRIIGAAGGYVTSDSNHELPFDCLESDPYRVILLDEFEKADKEVQRLFLPAFDNGSLTTARGKVIDFSKAIIIATTNAGREVLDGHTLGFGAATQTLSVRSLKTELTKHFDAELLGRFSATIGFNPISEAVFTEILAASYARERQRILARTPHHHAVLPEQLPTDELERLTRTEFIASQGARPAEQAVRTWIENALLHPAPAVIPSGA